MKFLSSAVFLGLFVSTANAFVRPTPYHRSASLLQPSHNAPTNTQLHAFDIASPALSAIDSFYQTQPYISAFVTCSVKASAADLVAQSRALAAAAAASTTVLSSTSTSTATPSPPAKDTTQRQLPQASDDHQSLSESSHSSFDLRRTLAFLLYGGFYQGMGQEYIYNNIFPSLFGTQATLQSVLMQVGLDTAILAPFVCLPMVYMLKSGVMGMTLPDGLKKYVTHIQEQALLLKYWSIWIPVQSLTFSVIPAHWRIAFVACVSFFWVCLLSTISSTNTAEQEMTTAKPESVKQ